MQSSDDAFVRLGRAAAGIQRAAWGKASTSEEMRVFKICFEAIEAASAAGQNSPESLRCAIAGELETNLVRKSEAAGRQHRENQSLQEGCLAVADLFVKDIWLGTLKGRFPSQRNRRILGSIYRMAFVLARKQQPALVELN